MSAPISNTASMRALLPRLPDLVLALLITLIGVVGTVAGHHYARHGHLDGIALTLIVCCGFSLAFRRIFPLVILGIVTVGVAGYLTAGYPYGPILLSLVVAVFTVAHHRQPRQAGIAAAGSLVLLLIPTFVTGPGFAGVIPASAWIVVPFAVGLVSQVRRETIVRQRAETLRRHVDDERLRIAQEVHDVVGHGLAAIKMQADVALHVLDKQPHQAQAALEAISHTSSDALDELRATLAMVRGNTGRDPAPGLERVSDLVQRTREAGVEVSLRVRGQRPELSTAIDLTGYRVLQESLTNVLRHAAAGQAEVTVEYRPEEIIIEVTNPADAALQQGGSGIAGMRRRVEALGGQFSAQVDAGRFRVHARLPLQEAS